MFDLLNTMILSCILNCPSPTKIVDEIVLFLKPYDPIVQCEENPHCHKLAEAIFFEGRGEPLVGQYAIAHTILNRTVSSKWPGTIRQVVNQKRKGVCQFTYMCQFTEWRRKHMISRHPEEWETSLIVAYEVLNGVIDDPTQGANHYYNPAKVKSKPMFAKTYDKVGRIGNHVFYRRADAVGSMDYDTGE